MPKMYTDMRDACYARKRKEGGGELSEDAKKECKKWAAIQYYKKTGKPVQHSEGDISLNDFKVLSRFYNKVLKDRKE